MGRPICYSLGAAWLGWRGREPGDLRSFYTPAPVTGTAVKTALVAPAHPGIGALHCCLNKGVLKKFRVTLRVGEGWGGKEDPKEKKQ